MNERFGIPQIKNVLNITQSQRTYQINEETNYRVGGGRLIPVPSHHLACGSALGGSSTLTELKVSLCQTLESLSGSVDLVHGLMELRRFRCSPNTKNDHSCESL
ncbi:hypothetical protein KN10_0918 [Anoxybacillus flavithermus NBRC 109594]|uniref:Uncharacterized protein n=1 Tax=Anoxybacillus flavithermus NBRC 109594 TaxID=1315967 RepID=R4G683_9BACL|nr:hypothetical protein KN10_0918 [Anoxybacillus flavithermus NBRC 109594]